MDKRTEYVEKLSAQMVEWDVQIERLVNRQAYLPVPPPKLFSTSAINGLSVKSSLTVGDDLFFDTILPSWGDDGPCVPTGP